jgi:hypothetical protein
MSDNYQLYLNHRRSDSTEGNTKWKHDYQKKSEEPYIGVGDTLKL